MFLWIGRWFSALSVKCAPPFMTDILLFDTARYLYWDSDLMSMEYIHNCEASNSCRDLVQPLRNTATFPAGQRYLQQVGPSSQPKHTAANARISHSDRAHWGGSKYSVQTCIPVMATWLEGGDVINHSRCCRPQSMPADSCLVCFCRLSVGN
jgi:hypothetical protein